VSKPGTVHDLYNLLADEISKGHGDHAVHLYFHWQHTSGGWLSEFATLSGSASEPEGEWRLYLSTAPVEGER
jgi:hypothetical protein